MEYTYMVALLDHVTQEPRHLLVKGDEKLLEVMKARPEHHIISSIQNLGPCEDSDDYVTEIKGKV
jgi:hypothetical protein